MVIYTLHAWRQGDVVGQARARERVGKEVKREIKSDIKCEDKEGSGRG